MNGTIIKTIFLVILTAGIFANIKEYRKNSRRYAETNDAAYQKSARRWRRCAIGHGILVIYLIADRFM